MAEITITIRDDAETGGANIKFSRDMESLKLAQDNDEALTPAELWALVFYLGMRDTAPALLAKPN